VPVILAMRPCARRGRSFRVTQAERRRAPSGAGATRGKELCLHVPVAEVVLRELAAAHGFERGAVVTEGTERPHAAAPPLL